MNEAELIKEIAIVEAKRRKVEAGKATGRGHKKVRFQTNLRTDETVAKQVGIGGKDTYRKAEKIFEHQDLIPVVVAKAESVVTLGEPR